MRTFLTFLTNNFDIEIIGFGDDATWYIFNVVIDIGQRLGYV